MKCGRLLNCSFVTGITVNPLSMSLTKFTLDTSALSDLISSDERAQRILDLLVERPVRLYVPGEALNEIFSGKDPDRVLPKGERLRDLNLLTKNDKVRCTRMIGEIIEAESETGGQLTSVPTVGFSRLWQTPLYIKGAMSVAHQKTLDTQEKLKPKLNERAIFDRKFRAMSRELDQNEIKHRILDFDSKSNLKYGSKLVENFLMHYLSRTQVRKILHQSPRCLVTKALANLVVFRYLLNAFTGSDPVIDRMKKIDPNNWPDLFIAATAAYGDFLVSDDITQREICNFLNKKGVVRFKAISSADFIRNLQAI